MQRSRAGVLAVLLLVLFYLNMCRQQKEMATYG